MKKNIIKSAALSVVILAAAAADGFSQIAAGGDYSLEQTVIASGGTQSVDPDGLFSINGTIGQALAGTTSSSGGYALVGGFWSAPTAAPTAAQISVKGRIRMKDGTGIRSVIVTLTENDGTTRTTVSSSFGYYQFTEIAAGQTVILTVTAKKFVFVQPTLFLNLTEDAVEADFEVY